MTVARITALRPMPAIARPVVALVQWGRQDRPVHVVLCRIPHVDIGLCGERRGTFDLPVREHKLVSERRLCGNCRRSRRFAAAALVRTDGLYGPVYLLASQPLHAIRAYAMDERD